MDSRTRHFVMLAAGLAGLLTACSLILGDGSHASLVPGRAGVFSHALHLGDEVGLDCGDCHLTAESEAEAGMPVLAGCLLCHDEELDAGKPPARTPAGFVLEGRTEATWTQVTAPAVPTTFSHAVHMETGAECESCHAGIRESEAVSTDLRIGMDDCLRCHESLQVEEGGCAGCHPGVDQNWQPPTHEEAAWMQVHGRLAPFGDMPAAAASQNCALCHQESECASCHSQTAPQDHTEAWRVRGHGFMAAMDRDRCANCHREDSCVRCHTQTAPISHNAAWGTPTDTHCLGCHEPLSGSQEGCFVCHKVARSHLLAPMRPPAPHPGPGANCRSCHMPVPHADNGADCIACHH